jgi:nucleotide-binding universal stress UspA family protein
MMNIPTIVVGTDGSAAGTAAVRWAATEAWLHDARLAVLAYPEPVPGDRRAAAEMAGTLVDAALAEARTIAPNIGLRGEPVLGDPAPALLAAARDAELVVVADRGYGGLGDIPHGPLSVHVTTHAPCPAVVVRGRANTAVGPVVVGVDGSEPAEAAVAEAFAEADLRRSTTLTAVTAYATPAGPWTGFPPPGYYLNRLDADRRQELDWRLSGWRDKYPEVRVDYAVVNGAAARVLIERSREAQLVVVGTRGRGNLDGMLLGSVGLQLIHHADCPVLIARH